jgi:hypothetical protein
LQWQIVFETFRDLASTDLAKMLMCGTLEKFMTTSNTLTLNIWDPVEFYDNLEHFVFKIMVTCGTDVEMTIPPRGKRGSSPKRYRDGGRGELPPSGTPWGPASD